METLELILSLTLVSIAGLVGLALWLSNQRALEHMKQDNLNYRAGLKAGSGAPIHQADEPDLMSTILDLAAKNPDLVEKFLGGMKGQQPPSIGM